MKEKDKLIKAYSGTEGLVHILKDRIRTKWNYCNYSKWIQADSFF